MKKQVTRRKAPTTAADALLEAARIQDCHAREAMLAAIAHLVTAQKLELARATLTRRRNVQA